MNSTLNDTPNSTINNIINHTMNITMNTMLNTIALEGTINEFTLKKINNQDNIGNTILHNAFLYKNVASIIVLLKYDMDINIQNLDGNTVLHLALFNFNLAIKNCDKKAFIYIDILKRLINKKGNMYIKNELNITPSDVVQFGINIQDNEGNTLLHTLIKRGKIEKSNFLIDFLNVNLNIKNIHGNTVLHEA
jgi:ankyrin repeat protein